MRSFKLLAAAALIAAAAGAQADTIDWGTLSVDGFYSNSAHVSGLFSDEYDFKLDGTFDNTALAVSANLANKFDITNGLITLFAAGGTELASYTFDGTTGSTTYDFGSLGIGSYYYVVTGLADGPKGGSYTFQAAINGAGT